MFVALCSVETAAHFLSSVKAWSLCIVCASSAVTTRVLLRVEGAMVGYLMRGVNMCVAGSAA